MAKKRFNDLISRKALLDIVGKMPLDWEYGKAVSDIYDIIKAAPAVDAVEVEPGYWEEWWPPKHMIFTGEEMLYRCSACTAKYEDISGYNYCPFCGTRMEIGTNEECETVF